MLTLNEIEVIKRHTGNDFSTVQTTDATATVIHTIETESNTVGIVEYLVLGMLDDGLEAVTGKKLFRYINDATTLSMGAESTVVAIDAETSLSTATFAANVNGTDLEIKVTGVAATTIEWKVIVQHWYQHLEIAV